VQRFEPAWTFLVIAKTIGDKLRPSNALPSGQPSESNTTALKQLVLESMPLGVNARHPR